MTIKKKDKKELAQLENKSTENTPVPFQDKQAQTREEYSSQKQYSFGLPNK